MRIRVVVLDVRGALDERAEREVRRENCGRVGAEVVFEEAVHITVVAKEDGIEGCVCVVGLDGGWLDLDKYRNMRGIEVCEG